MDLRDGMASEQKEIKIYSNTGELGRFWYQED